MKNSMLVFVSLFVLTFARPSLKDENALGIQSLHSTLQRELEDATSKKSREIDGQTDRVIVRRALAKSKTGSSGRKKSKRIPISEGLAKDLGFGESLRTYEMPKITPSSKSLTPQERMRKQHVACRVRCGTKFSECMRIVSDDAQEESIICGQGRHGCIMECGIMFRRRSR